MMKQVRIVAGAAMLAVFALATIGDAQAQRSKIAGSTFLGWGEKRKEVYVSALMDGQSSLVEECVPDHTAEQVAASLTEWINKNPAYIQRPAHRAFMVMVSGMCKE